MSANARCRSSRDASGSRVDQSVRRVVGKDSLIILKALAEHVRLRVAPWPCGVGIVVEQQLGGLARVAQHAQERLVIWMMMARTIGRDQVAATIGLLDHRPVEVFL